MLLREMVWGKDADSCPLSHDSSGVPCPACGAVRGMVLRDMIYKYDPSQPRVSRGSPQGGQFESSHRASPKLSEGRLLRSALRSNTFGISSLRDAYWVSPSGTPVRPTDPLEHLEHWEIVPEMGIDIPEDAEGEVVTQGLIHEGWMRLSGGKGFGSQGFEVWELTPVYKRIITEYVLGDRDPESVFFLDVLGENASYAFDRGQFADNRYDLDKLLESLKGQYLPVDYLDFSSQRVKIHGGKKKSLSEMIYKYDPAQPRDEVGRWSETGGRNPDKTFLNNVQEGNFSGKDFQSIGRGEYGAELVFYEDGTKGIRKDEFANETDPLQDGNREVAAYRISDQLGLDVVPPTDFYSPLAGGRRSTIQKYVENSRIGAELGVSGVRNWIESNPEQAGKVVLLDFLLGNSDRHFANFLIDFASKIWAIDNGNMGTPWQTLRYWERKFHGLDFEKMVKKNRRLISSWKKITRSDFDSWFDAVSEKKTFKKDKVWERLQDIIAAGGIPE